MYLFNAKIENPEKLEKMLVGRKQVVDTLVDAQLEHSKGGMPPQFLVVGPRGSGKTHILRIIYDRLSRNADFMATHEIAYMVEDETGIGSYFDLLQRIFQALKRWSNDEQKKRFIVDQVEKLKDVHPNTWAKTAESILLNILKDKSLLVLIENFDAILKGIDKKAEVVELAKLRDFIQQHNQLSFIATSQSLINSLSNNQNPLYGFFHTIHLKRLTLEESFEYVKKIAQAENNDELVQFLETHAGRGHLEAIHQFTKGNHRLLLVFFDFLKAEFRSNLSEVFLKSIDELKPYYEGFLRNLAPQQQKIVQYLCLQRNPQKGADISRNCFLEKTTVSKQLSDLQLLGYVSAVNEKGRDKYYEINEPLLRMCIEINEDRNGIIKLFVNFLGQLYTSEQLKEKYLHYKYLERFQPEPIRKLYQAEAKIYEMVRSQYLASWQLDVEEERELKMCSEREEAKKIIDTISHSLTEPDEEIEFIKAMIQKENWIESINLINKRLVLDPENAVLYNLLGFPLMLAGQYDKAIGSYLKAITIDPSSSGVWANLGEAYIQAEQYDLAIDALKKSIELDNNDDCDLWYKMGFSFLKSNQFDSAVDAFQKSLDIDENQFIAWYDLGRSYYHLENFKQSLNAFLKAIEIDPDETTWYSLGMVYDKLNQGDKAIEAYLIAIQKKKDFKEAWFSLGISYFFKEEYDEAQKAYLKAIDIDPYDKIIWNNLALLYLMKDQNDKAIESFNKSLSIDPNSSMIWNALGIANLSQNNLSDAKSAFYKALELSDEVRDESYTGYYSNLILVTFKLKVIKEALSSIEELFSKPERLEFISELEDALVLLCKDNSEDAITEILNRLLQICETNQATEKLSALLSNVVFRILKEYQEIKPFKIELLQHILDELFGDKPEFTYPLKYLNIGIRCFLKGEKEAIYEMSQEERLIFEKFTSSESKE